MGPDREAFPARRTVHLPARGRQPRRRATLDAPTPSRSWRSRSLSVLVLYLLLRVQGVAAAVAGVPRRGARPGVQHGGVVRDQHELAVLRGRVDDGPPGPDELASPSRTSSPPPSASRRRRPDPRVRRVASPRRSATSGPTWCAAPSGSCCRSRSWARVVLISQGVVQNFHAAQEVTTVQGATQSIPGGPVASQEAIKELGTNGGGFYNANSAHPFENPNPFTNLLRDVPAARDPVRPDGHVRQDGRQPQTGLRPRRRDGAVVARLDVARRGTSNPSRTLRCTRPQAASVSGGNMEGKEVRFGIPASGAFAAATTGTSTGAVIAAHDSFTPFGGGVVAGEHDAVGGLAGRGRLGPVRHARPRDRGRVHRRAHGRAARPSTSARRSSRAR